MAFGFFNYQKEGKGVDKDEYTPRLPLYFKLFFRKWGLMTKANFVYILTNILILIFAWVGYFSFSAQGELGLVKGVIFLSFVTIYLSVVGVGFLMPGITYLTRNFARQRHVWILSDFFEQVVSNFKKGLAIFVADVAVIYISYIAINVYTDLIKQNNMMIVPLAILEVALLIYFMMHFYIYPIMVTFDLSFKNILRNSFILTMAHLPWNLLITVVILLITFGLYLVFPYIAIIVMLVFGVAFLNFTINYMVDPIIDKHLYIPAKTIEENQKNEFDESVSK